MSYISPETVCSPKNLVKDVNVIYDKGPRTDSWSVATLKWAEKDAVGIRWNGSPEDSGVGTPQSRGLATWFILPDELAEFVVNAAASLKRNTDDSLIQGYQAMAHDDGREEEALEWSEALIRDAVTFTGSPSIPPSEAKFRRPVQQSS